MVGSDVIGNIAIIKFSRDAKLAAKKKYALEFLKKHKSVTTVLEKYGKFSGRLRTQKTRYISGEKTTEALCRENGCVFRLNVDTCYFSPRLASERKEIALMTKWGESVLVMFAGVAPFSIVISKMSKAAKVVSVELGRECTKYALQNVKRNKLKNVEIIGGDVRRVFSRSKDKFSRIVMARPNLKDSFLDVAFPLISKNGVIHYYGFYEEKDLEKLKELIKSEALKAKKKIKILKIKKAAGGIGVRKYRYRADIKVN